MAQREKLTARITIRLTGAQLEDLTAAADKRERTTNWLARDILITWLKKHRPRRKK